MIPRSTPRLLAIALLSGLLGFQPALAQDTGRLFVAVTLADDALKGLPVMVSAISGGEVVFQSELLMTRSSNIPVNLGNLLVGEYDVRIEGEGIVTEVKRGIHVFGGRVTNLQAVVRPGEGLHVVQYATGGLAREEVAARLSRLEGIVAELPPDITGMADIPEPEGAEPCCNVTAIDVELGLVTAIDSRTGRTIQFQVSDRAVLRTVQMGDKVWADFDTGKVGLNPADPCCTMRTRP